MKHNNLSLVDRENSGEENLTDDAIKEIDFDHHRINSTTQGSPLIGYSSFT